MLRSLSLAYPSVPVSLNQWMRWHPMVRAKHAAQVKQDIGWLVVAAKWRGPALEKATVTYRFFFPGSRRRDPDNYLAATKFLADGLVQAGVLTDDDFAHYQPVLALGGVDKRNPRVEITVEEAAK